jgi:Acyl-CoA dehydrogenase, C-terminal domain
MGGRAIDSNELFIEDFPIPESDLLGQEGRGFKMVLEGMNAERCLLAGEAIGTGLAALKRATQYAQERVVFSRPIGQNQGIAHPLAEAWMNLEAAKLLAYRAARMFDEATEASTTIGVYCNSAKYLAAEAAFKACERAVLTLGGMGYAQVIYPTLSPSRSKCGSNWGKGLPCGAVFARDFCPEDCTRQWRTSQKYDFDESSWTTKELLDCDCTR